MKNLTVNEKLVLKEITEDNFFEDGLDSLVWCDCFLEFGCSLVPKVARGVLSSLIKKEYIYPISKARDENYIQFTNKGKEYLKSELKIKWSILENKQWKI